MTAATPTSPPLLHGRYRIEAKLGTGRLAVVYRARDERLQRPVLVHLLRPELVSQAPLRQRFIEESHASARRSHQSLLEVFDSGEVGERPFMITEYVAGRTLRELGALSPEEALLYVRQVVGAVAACQAAGVPHPPISSSNLILVDDGHVELLENWQTPTSEIARDLAAYRAPERTEGQPVSNASAVYALGLLLWELLAGRRAVADHDPRAATQAHLTLRLAALSEVRPTLYVPELERLITRATARRPQDRPQDAAALGRELDNLRRAIASETQRLAAPPVQRSPLRQRVHDTATQIAGVPARAPEPVVVRTSAADEDIPPTVYKRGRQAASPVRAISGIIIVSLLFLFAIGGGYYLANRAIQRLTNYELPLPQISLPSLPDVGIHLPELPSWLTGVVSGRGEVLVVTGDGLNLRETPGLNTTVIAPLPSGTRVRKLEGPQVVDSVPWLRVRASVGEQELEGWVSQNYLKSEEAPTP